MVAHEEEFAPHVDEGLTVEQWCNANVDPSSSEMDELSLVAAYRAVVEPTGMVVRVHALERNSGDRAHVSSYEPSTKVEGQGEAPALNLLYRP